MLLFDALCDHADAELSGEVEHRGDDLAVGLAVETLDERAVDLEHVEREPLDVAERRVAGAEVVDRQACAERSESLHPLLDDVGVRQQVRLGHLEHQAVGGKAGSSKDVGHHRISGVRLNEGVLKLFIELVINHASTHRAVELLHELAEHTMEGYPPSLRSRPVKNPVGHAEIRLDGAPRLPDFCDR